MTQDSDSIVEGYYQFIDKNKKWYKNLRLVTLNLWILLLYALHKSSGQNFYRLIKSDSLITSTANGYDGSMMSMTQFFAIKTIF